MNYGDIEAIHYFRGVPINSMMGRFGDNWRSLPGEAEAAIFRWNAATEKIERLSNAEAGVAMYGVARGTFGSTVEAWATPPEGAKCLMPHFIVATDPFPELEPGHVMFVDWGDVAVGRLEAYKWARTLAGSSRTAFAAKLTAFPVPCE